MDDSEEGYPEGFVAAGRYEVIRRLGSGGMGAVYEALDTRVDRLVALKFLAKGLVGNAEMRKRFEREAKAAGRIDHDNVCGVTDWGFTHEGVPFLVMELLRGEPLDRLIARKGKLTGDEAVGLMGQVLSALAAAHLQGIVHRDLKPENIFVVRASDGEERVKLLDFGIAKFIGNTQGTTKAGILIGTLQYMSPEQAMGASLRVDHRTDLWAAGVIIYEMLSGLQPFARETVPEALGAIINDHPAPLADLDPSIPDFLSAAVERAMSKQPEDRFESAAQLAAALRGEEVELEVEELEQAPTQIVLAEAVLGPESTGPTTIPPGGPEPRGPKPGDTDPEARAPATVTTDSKAPATVATEMPAVTMLSTTTDRREAGSSSRTRTLIAGVAIAVLLVGGVVGIIVGLGGGGGEVPEPRVAAVSPGPDLRPGPDQRPGPDAAAVAKVAAPATVVLEVSGLPEGASASWQGAPLAAGRITGPAGQAGELLIEAPGHEPVKLALTLERSGQLDLTRLLPPPVEEQAPAAKADAGPSKTASRQRDGGTPRKTGGGKTYATGRDNSKVLLDYHTQ